jgi:hypothetical protein
VLTSIPTHHFVENEKSSTRGGRVGAHTPGINHRSSSSSSSSMSRFQRQCYYNGPVPEDEELVGRTGLVSKISLKSKLFFRGFFIESLYVPPADGNKIEEINFKIIFDDECLIS